MSRQGASIIIERPPEEVFAFMDDISCECDWRPDLKSVTKEPEGPTQVGTHKHYVGEFLGNDLQNTYEVTEFEAGRRIVYQTTKDSALKATAELTCVGVEDGTKVTMVIDAKPKGFLRLVPQRERDSAHLDQLKTALRCLKECLESE